MTEHPVIAEDTGVGRLQVQIQTQGASFTVDEPADTGDLAPAPSPFDLLSASLGACTVMTIKFYANRKGIPVSRVQVIVGHRRHPDTGRDIFQRSIFIDGDIDEGQMAQLFSVADRCPVSRTLSAGADIATSPSAAPAITGRRTNNDEHLRAMRILSEDKVLEAEWLTG